MHQQLTRALHLYQECGTELLLWMDFLRLVCNVLFLLRVAGCIVDSSFLFYTQLPTWKPPNLIMTLLSCFSIGLCNDWLAAWIYCWSKTFCCSMWKDPKSGMLHFLLATFVSLTLYKYTSYIFLFPFATSSMTSYIFLGLTDSAFERKLKEIF